MLMSGRSKFAESSFNELCSLRSRRRKKVEMMRGGHGFNRLVTSTVTLSTGCRLWAASQAAFVSLNLMKSARISGSSVPIRKRFPFFITSSTASSPDTL